MFDTNVFNRILDGQLSLDAIRGKIQAYATHIQHDEIQNTRNTERRIALLAVFRREIAESKSQGSPPLDPQRLDEAPLTEEKLIPTASAVWGISRWGEACWSEDDNIFSGMKDELDKLNRNKANNVNDILIAETALKNRLILVTDDGDLRTVIQRFGGEAMCVADFGTLGSESAT